ncbi:DUF6894 family protein [Mesorhizobium sp. WSM4962]|uniref:DUF6894 family protein n=1 Tax=Mesorhizobium sp. WSM4962 TaxID=3038548 RepID=UPI003FA59E82
MAIRGLAITVDAPKKGPKVAPETNSGRDRFVERLSNGSQAACPSITSTSTTAPSFPILPALTCPNLDAAQVEAVRAAGEMINDTKQSFWTHKTPWIMHVTDDRNRLLFSLQFAAKVPSGDALYIPRTEDSSAGQKESPAT